MGNAVVKPLSSSPRADCPPPEAGCSCPCPSPSPSLSPSPEPLELINPCYLWHHGHQGIDNLVLYDTVAAAYAAAQMQVALIKERPHYWHKTEAEVMSDIDTNSFSHNHVFPDTPGSKDRMWSVYQTADLQVYLGLGYDLPTNIQRCCPEGYYISDSNAEDPDMPPLFNDPLPSLVA